MLICVDIGNSSIGIGYFGPDRLIVQSLQTHPRRSSQEYAGLLEAFLIQNHIEKTAVNCIISSVVPAHTSVLADACRELGGKAETPLIISRKLNTGLVIDLNEPDSLGSDRLTNAAAARFIYKKATAVVDFGTATTVTVVDDKATLVGGAILPGIGLMGTVLSERTAQLPMALPEPAEAAIGRNTVSCIRSGIFFGTAGAVERIIAAAEEELGSALFMVITGGGSLLMQQFMTRPFERRPDLIFEGLKFIYEENRS